MKVALAAGSFLVALVLSGVGGCNLHELGHLVFGWLAGVPVEGILWCAPGNGRIVFAYQEPALVGYAGGITAAVILGVAYWRLVWPRRDQASWAAAGVAILGTAISQVIVGVLEGSSPARYAALQDNTAGLVGILVAPLVTAAAVQMLAGRTSPRSPR